MTKMPELDVLLFQYILLILEQLSFQKMLSLPLTYIPKIRGKICE